MPEVMYEFSIDMSGVTGTVDLAALGADLGFAHFSPNKLGGNKVGVFDAPIPLAQKSELVDVSEPNSIFLFGFGLAGLYFIRRRRAA